MRTSRKRPLGLFAAAILLAAGMHSASATEAKPTWGNTPGLTTPQPDLKGRAGYWWWPKPEAGAEPREHPAGNRGRVYGAWEPTEESPAAQVEPPCPEQPPPREAERRLILNGVLFPFDSAELTVWAKAEIERTVLELEWFFKQYTNDRVVCVGHTDDVGAIEYNQRLGARRAQVVRDYMLEQGIAEPRIGIKSFGETQPAVPNDTPANRALNRRVEFEIAFGD